MPLIDYSSSEAIRTRKGNVFAAWGHRAQANRVEPLTMPSFDVPFDIRPGEKIFTVGSCFARNVEVELLRRGFELPMRDLFRTEAFRGLDPGLVNNFGTPSIYNEIAWALGAKPYVADDHIVEVQSGKFVDLHVISSIRPEARDAVEARRRAITAAYRAVLDCRVVIMTLGLIEVWFDHKSGFYLNSTPLPSLLRAEPDRFRLHVLSFEETYRHLDDAISLMKKKGREDLQVILTVSPVPLTVTHRDQDVIVANSFSKSVLRAAAETITVKNSFVTYFPSYESVVLSDRKLTWRDDFTHVTDQIVALNVERMIDAFVPGGRDLAALDSEITAGGLIAAIEEARRVRTGSFEAATVFFGKYRYLSEQSVDFALEHAQFLSDAKRYDDVLQIMDVAPGGSENDKTALITADALLRLGRARESYERMDAVVTRGNKSAALWSLLMRAAQAVGDQGLVLGVLGRWSRIAPKRAGRANGMVARWLFERGEVAPALNYFKIAMGLDGGDALSGIYYAETLMSLGRFDDAVDVIQKIHPQSSSEVILHGRIVKALGVGV